MRRLWSSSVALPALLSQLVAGLAAQQRTCDLVESRQARAITQPDGRVNHVSQPRFQCSDGARIEADSSVTFEASFVTRLYGSVRFRDGIRELLSDRAQYFSGPGRLDAQGSVRLTDLSDGSTVTGQNLVMLQAGRQRPEDDLTVRGGRPHARFHSRAVPVSEAPQPEEPELDDLEGEAPALDADLAATDTVSVPEEDSDPVEAEPEEAGAFDPQVSEAEVVGPPPPPGPPQPFDVDADLIRLLGDRLFQARGRVEIRQDALRSYGDSMQYRQDSGVLTLYHNARILSPDPESGDTLHLSGDTIDMRLPNNRIDELEARGHARLLRGALDIRGPIVRMLFVQEDLDRIVAVVGEAAAEELADSSDVLPDDPSPPEEPADSSDIPTEELSTPPEESADSSDIVIDDPFARPWATAEDFTLTGDSVEVRAPGGELETVFASGNARGISSAQDSLNTEDVPELIRNDWIEGQEITATFTAAERDSTLAPSTEPAGEASQYRLDMLVAQGEARSFYRSVRNSAEEPEEGRQPSVNLNYVLGDEIRLFMRDGQVDRMEVDNPSGTYFQAQPPPDTIPGDTLPPPPDTIPGDTLPPPSDTIVGDTLSPTPPDTTSARTEGGSPPLWALFR